MTPKQDETVEILDENQNSTKHTEILQNVCEIKNIEKVSLH